jgi:3-deoxy-D-manno-octulosonate 8-phosphate phosphatase KdsC-like HAD superfamily phosphatase
MELPPSVWFGVEIDARRTDARDGTAGLDSVGHTVDSCSIRRVATIESKSTASFTRRIGYAASHVARREPEVHALATKIGIQVAYGAQAPEDKVALVRAETERTKTVFIGDGINDAPAMQAATVGIAFGHENDITSEAADAVLLDRSLGKVDELIHIGHRMRTIALQSAVGGMALSAIGMGFAAFGWLPPISGAVAQEVIDLLAVLNAVRVALPGGPLRDF